MSPTGNCPRSSATRERRTLELSDLHGPRASVQKSHGVVVKSPALRRSRDKHTHTCSAVWAPARERERERVRAADGGRESCDSSAGLERWRPRPRQRSPSSDTPSLLRADPSDTPGKQSSRSAGIPAAAPDKQPPPLVLTPASGDKRPPLRWRSCHRTLTPPKRRETWAAEGPPSLQPVWSVTNRSRSAARNRSPALARTKQFFQSPMRSGLFLGDISPASGRTTPGRAPSSPNSSAVQGSHGKRID